MTFNITGNTESYEEFLKLLSNSAGIEIDTRNGLILVDVKIFYIVFFYVELLD